MRYRWPLVAVGVALLIGGGVFAAKRFRKPPVEVEEPLVERPEPDHLAEAMAVTANDNDIQRTEAIKVLRDYAQLDDLLRLAKIEEPGTQGDDVACFVGAAQCLLGDRERGLFRLNDCKRRDGALARRACGGSVRDNPIRKLEDWQLYQAPPDAVTPAAMALLPPLDKGLPPGKAEAALLARANADESLKMPPDPIWGLAPQYLGLHPTKDDAAEWQKTFRSCSETYNDPWAVVPPEYRSDQPPVLASPDRMIAAAAVTPECLSHRLIMNAAWVSAKQGHRAQTRDLIARIEAFDPDIEDSALWLAIDGYAEAKARAEKALAKKDSYSERRNLALAALGLRDFASAYENAEKSRALVLERVPPSNGTTAPNDAMEALWVMSFAAGELHREIPANLVRYETEPEKRLTFQDAVRYDSEEAALHMWWANLGDARARIEQRGFVRGLRSRGSGVECTYWLATAALAKDQNPETWLEGLDARLEHANFGNWRGGAIARARCHAMILGVMNRPSSKTWTERADRLSALIKDQDTAVLAYFVGL